ncbi:MAG TPA: hypothetical protein PLB87_11425 [Prolixibacteraceae bacterium]|nr:hypothetical protein [Prolixibacteraceae bacterium]
MKKLLFFIPVLMLIFCNCSQFDKLTQFNMVYNDTLSLPSSSGINLPVDTQIPDVETNSESTFSINNTHKDLIEEILLKEMTLTVTTPSNGNFTFLKSIAIYMSADGLDEVKVAWQDSIPADCGNTLTLKTSDADLKAYIQKDKFKYRMNTVVQKVISSDYQIAMHSVFFVDAKILGQ